MFRTVQLSNRRRIPIISIFSIRPVKEVNTDGKRKQRAISQINWPVSNPGDVRYNKKKTEGYLLNPNHPVGVPKAKFMHDVLGYSQSDGKLFQNKVVEAIQNKQPDKTDITRFGTKHTYKTMLGGKDGKNVSVNVVIVIQKDNSRKTFKVVTVYPDK